MKSEGERRTNQTVNVSRVLDVYETFKVGARALVETETVLRDDMAAWPGLREQRQQDRQQDGTRIRRDRTDKKE